jgi:hypothetical protein
LFLTDNRGLPLVCDQVIAGQHNDAHCLAVELSGIIAQLRQAKIRIDGVFLNADAGFDSHSFKLYCKQNDTTPNIDINPRNGTKNEQEGVSLFDEKLYRYKYVIKRTNAWLDALKVL